MQNTVDDVSPHLTAAGSTRTDTVVLLHLDSGALERKVYTGCVHVRSAVWLSGNALASINVVALRQTRLVLGWVSHFGM